MSTELRAAVVFLTDHVCPWTVDELARLGSSGIIRARAYATVLVSQGVLVRIDDATYRAGPKAAAWRATPSKARAGGNAKDYREKKALRDSIRARDWNVRRTSHPETLNPARLTSHEAADANTPPQGDAMATPGTFYTIADVARKLAVHEETVRREISRGRLKAQRVGMRGLRIHEDALDAYLTTIEAQR